MRLVSFFAASVPVVVAWIAKVIVVPRPFWAHYYDPETIYFYEGLRLARGEVPVNVDNPATPVQVMSAAIALITGRTPAAYERFLLVAHIAGLVLILVAVAVLLRTLLRELAPPLQVAAVWGLFIAPQMFERIDVWGPELFFLPAASLALAAAWRWNGERTDRSLLFFAAAVGLCVSVKFVFIAWAVALLVIAWRRVHVAIAGLALGFFIGTCAIVPRYFELVPRLLRNSHSRGEQTWGDLLPHQNAWLLWLVAVVALAAWRARQHRALLVFAAVAFVMTYIQALRAPAFRYLLPTAFCVLLVLTIAFQRTPPRRVQMAIVALAAVLVTATGIADFRNHLQRIREAEELRAAIEARVTKTGVVLYGWRTPMPSFALRVMATDARDLAVVSAIYPREGHFDPWRRRVVLPEGATRWDEVVLRRVDLPQFPEPTGGIKASAGPFVIVRAAG